MEFLNQVGRMNRPLRLLLTNIRNAAIKRKIYAAGPYSVLNTAVLTVLYEEGIISTFSTKVDVNSKWLYEVRLRPESYSFFKRMYVYSSNSVDADITYEYLSANLINEVFFGVLSTSEGVMSLKTAVSKKIGGKLMLVLR